MYTVSGTIFEHFKIEVSELRVTADLFTITKEILKESITFNAVPVSTRQQNKKPISKDHIFKRF